MRASSSLNHRAARVLTMATHPDSHCTCPATYSSPNDRPQSLWPDKMLRTYLWALRVQSESSLSGYESDSCCDYDYSSFDPRPSVRVNTARYSLKPWDEMAQTSLSDVYCSVSSLFSHPMRGGSSGPSYASRAVNFLMLHGQFPCLANSAYGASQSLVPTCVYLSLTHLCSLVSFVLGRRLRLRPRSQIIW